MKTKEYNGMRNRYSFARDRVVLIELNAMVGALAVFSRRLSDAQYVYETMHVRDTNRVVAPLVWLRPLKNMMSRAFVRRELAI